MKSDGTAASVISAKDVHYRMYKRRYAGLVGFIALNIVSAMSWPWFGPISETVAVEFELTITQVNWIGNIVSFVFIPASLSVPYLCSKWGMRYSAYFGGVTLLLSAWVRYAGTVEGLSVKSAYALILLGQVFAAISQPVWQVLGPMYSERWFDLKGRTTATMLIAVSNPVGGAIGQIISPLPSTTRRSILLLGIISTAVLPLILLIGEAPPTPPTFSGSQKPKSLWSLVKAILGMKVDEDSFMTVRERIDFVIIMITFGCMVGQSLGFSLLTGEIFVPFGYSPKICGFLGSTLLLSGLVASIITSPILDRVFTHSLRLYNQVCTPIVGLLWLSLIWIVKPDNTGACFAIMALIGVMSVPTLPVALELACEITRNADGSAAILWCMANIFGIIFVLAGSALAAPLTGPIPDDMHRDLVFSGSLVVVISFMVLGVKGKQVRRDIDEQHNKDNEKATA
ncbi:MFS general substrate transporter [Athelia psychrophila]|uniref:MFS general substrate transporter n=1 Tax=Athelia psychrophila TaxID=1759441 RepID=A0A166KYE5_9AGAM|nr:MFS general substrate transporter [Fibularhizoctonia sp. CBS 109695]